MNNLLLTILIKYIQGRNNNYNEFQTCSGKECILIIAFILPIIIFFIWFLVIVFKMLISPRNKE